MVGRKLIERLARDGQLGGKPIAKVTLHDVVAAAARRPARPSPSRRVGLGHLDRAGEAETLVAARPDVIFHLAAIVSGEAEADFDKGYRINLDGTRHLFEAIRKAGGGYKPRARLHLVDRRVRRALPGHDRRRVLHRRR